MFPIIMSTIPAPNHWYCASSKCTCMNYTALNRDSNQSIKLDTLSVGGFLNSLISRLLSAKPGVQWVFPPNLKVSISWQTKLNMQLWLLMSKPATCYVFYATHLHTQNVNSAHLMPPARPSFSSVSHGHKIKMHGKAWVRKKGLAW